MAAANRPAPQAADRATTASSFQATALPVEAKGLPDSFLANLDALADIRQNVYVRVISLKRLRDFWERHPRSEAALRAWYKAVLGADWRSLQDVRVTYPHADGIRTGSGEALTVFNIGGNTYRLVARIRFDYKLVNVWIVLTHAGYDKGTWKEE